jgi:HAD superfamily hydrolase (TIGR01509 family)
MPQPTLNFQPALWIFDKDGTLLDFHRMWGGWAMTLADRLENQVKQPLRADLFRLLGFVPERNYIAPEGHLAITPLTDLQILIAHSLREYGLTASAAHEAMLTAWCYPDPVTAAHPITDLHRLFTQLRERGAKIAIATSDNRALTEATLIALRIDHVIDALVCADDGLPIKPAPEMILSVCEQVGVSPRQAMMVGDNPDDLKMGLAAGVSKKIGVLSGVSTHADLAPHADIVLSSIAALTA